VQKPPKFDYKSRCRQLVLRIECDALRRYLGALLGQEIGNDPVFDETEVRNPTMRGPKRRVFHFADDFNERGASSPISRPPKSNA
jgi:hypothetical protein